MTKLNPKCTQKWWNYSFKIPWKHLKGDKIHENPLHENSLILQSLDEHALKNSVILELYDFWECDGITYLLHIFDEITHHG